MSLSGPFTRPVSSPVLSAIPELSFDCPMRGRPIHWAARHVFNPAAVVHEGRIHLLFRAEDDTGTGKIGSYTSRVGLASSEDGIHFEVRPEPVLFPADDDFQEQEWFGGCEDPRVVQREDGLFVLYYTMYGRREGKGRVCIGAASSPDLIHWTKHGPIFAGHPQVLEKWHKATAVVQSVQEGRLQAVKLQGKYWMYWGEHALCAAVSDDLITWAPVCGEDGTPTPVISPMAGRFDSVLTEAGPGAVYTDEGIVVIYNGKNSKEEGGGDDQLGPGAYAAGQLITDPENPTQVLHRPEKPFLIPELDFEKTGQYRQGTIFTEGLVLFNDTWFLYYGAADSVVGVATAPF